MIEGTAAVSAPTGLAAQVRSVGTEGFRVAAAQAQRIAHRAHQVAWCRAARPACRAGRAGQPRPPPRAHRGRGEGHERNVAPLRVRRNSSTPPVAMRDVHGLPAGGRAGRPRCASSATPGAPEGPPRGWRQCLLASRAPPPSGATIAWSTASVRRAPLCSALTARLARLGDGQGEPGGSASPISGRSASNSAWILIGLAASEPALRSQPTGSAIRPGQRAQRARRRSPRRRACPAHRARRRSAGALLRRRAASARSPRAPRGWA